MMAINIELIMSSSQDYLYIGDGSSSFRNIVLLAALLPQSLYNIALYS